MDPLTYERLKIKVAELAKAKAEGDILFLGCPDAIKSLSDADKNKVFEGLKLFYQHGAAMALEHCKLNLLLK